MAVVGYARTSSQDQMLDLQTDALTAAGVERIFADQASGARPDRPGLDAALSALAPGDTLTVWRLDRLGRSLAHLSDTIHDLNRRGIGFRSLSESIDTTTAAGRLVLHMLGAFAEFERDLARERIGAGIAAARSRGRNLGRRPTLAPDQIALAQRLHAEGESLRQIARTVRGRNGKHPSPSTVAACLSGRQRPTG